MLQRYQNRLNMWRAVAKYLTDRMEIWQGNAAFSRAVDALKRGIADAETAGREQALSTTGSTEDRHVIELRAINALLPILKNARAYALEVENNTLYQQVNYTRSSLLALTDSDSLVTMQELLKTVSPHAAALAEYGLEDDALTVAEQRVADYKAVMSEPRLVVVDRSVATQSLPEIMRAGSRTLKRLDNLTHNFDKVRPDFTAGYKGARKVIDAGIRHEDEDDNTGPSA